MSHESRIAGELEQLERRAGFLPLEGAGLVRVTGPGHRDVLQRVLSQDLRALAPGAGTLALLLAPKGQFRALMAVFAGADETLLMAGPGRAAALAEALRRYLALSRCAAEAVADRGGATAIVGARWLESAAALGGDPGVLADGGWHAASLVGRPVSWFGRTPLGVPGAVLTEGGEELAEELRGHGVRALLPETVHLARLRRGAPAWGAELTDSVLPPEVGIDEEAISYSKGCYVGQETIARMKTHGHPTRVLVGVRQTRGEPNGPALPVPLTRTGEEKVRGTLTSWGWHPEAGGVGLALVRLELAVEGTQLGGAGREFKVAGFPLW
ncbi:MAG TPA: hypothetical protein VMT19_11020 [Thermoanaerobaculaceae bacterium]|nr:hypothetical protein [Thermoanaerobaculaceae bacterium]